MAAIKEARKQLFSWSGQKESDSALQLEVPATMPVVKELCGLGSIKKFLHWTIVNTIGTK
ncbi:aldehyde oxidase 4-like protein [Corchorus capsularis]|uniref:Aldehyde oxidase 4-like protein n=1 Tax=Corchorus capsularis TaxID=210143 RepID=A0A1R3J8C7_COCAP|nr:aldehyde oxidase 4-like protein [Corchorus capsularis]